MHTLVPTKAHKLYELARMDPARNYFVCLTLDNHQTYLNSWQITQHDEPVFGLFLRKTGILQMIKHPDTELMSLSDETSAIIRSISWKQANVTTAFKDYLLFINPDYEVKEAAMIAALESKHYIPRHHDMKLRAVILDTSHLSEVVTLYQRVFKSFASQSYMEEKLLSKRGRAVGLFMNHQLVAVAQSDYEGGGKAVIVGVATHPEYQGMGYGRACLEVLVDQLLDAQMTLYLQYDSPTAGKLYESMGFKPFDRVYYVINDIIGDDL